jgi:hypothetical protein
VLCFDYPRVAEEAGIPADKLEELARLIHREWNGAQMMADLHILKAWPCGTGPASDD